MAEVIREREVHDVHSEGGSAGWAVAAVVIIALVLFLIFGLPLLRNDTPEGTNINPPTNNIGY